MRAWSVLAFAAAAALATLINPYGFGLWRFLLETVRFGREGIEEWGPIWTYPHLLLLWSVFTAMVAVALWKGTVPLVSARALVSIAWCIASVRVSRLDSFFALSVIVLIGSERHQVLQLGTKRRPRATQNRHRDRRDAGAVDGNAGETRSHVRHCVRALVAGAGGRRPTCARTPSPVTW